MENFNQLVSIIVPVYNNELRVERCILSILKQTYSNIEVIIINDGSLDNSEEVILGIKDDRIRYFYQNNSGPSVARNKGLDVANGEYIVFIDSDDYIHPNMIEELVITANKYNVEIVSCNVIKQVGENKYLEVKEPYLEIQSWQEYYTRFILFNGLCSLWNKLIRRSLFHNIRLYDDIRLGEDSSVFLRILPTSSKIAHINQFLYIYDLTNEGLSRNVKKHVYEYMIAISRVLEFYKQNSISLPLPDYFLRLKVCYYTLYFCPLNKAIKLGYFDYWRLAKDFNKDFFRIVRNTNFKKISWKYKAFTLFYNIKFLIFYKNKKSIYPCF